jgi:hypothetical protein
MFYYLIFKSNLFRNQYPRLLEISLTTINTLDPSTLEITNTWSLQDLISIEKQHENQLILTFKSPSSTSSSTLLSFFGNSKSSPLKLTFESDAREYIINQLSTSTTNHQPTSTNIPFHPQSSLSFNAILLQLLQQPNNITPYNIPTTIYISPTTTLSFSTTTTTTTTYNLSQIRLVTIPIDLTNDLTLHFTDNNTYTFQTHQREEIAIILLDLARHYQRRPINVSFSTTIFRWNPISVPLPTSALDVSFQALISTLSNSKTNKHDVVRAFAVFNANADDDHMNGIKSARICGNSVDCHNIGSFAIDFILHEFLGVESSATKPISQKALCNIIASLGRITRQCEASKIHSQFLSTLQGACEKGDDLVCWHVMETLISLCRTSITTATTTSSQEQQFSTIAYLNRKFLLTENPTWIFQLFQTRSSLLIRTSIIRLLEMCFSSEREQTPPAVYDGLIKQATTTHDFLTTLSTSFFLRDPVVGGCWVYRDAILILRRLVMDHHQLISSVLLDTGAFLQTFLLSISNNNTSNSNNNNPLLANIIIDYARELLHVCLYRSPSTLRVFHRMFPPGLSHALSLEQHNTTTVAALKNPNEILDSSTSSNTFQRYLSMIDSLQRPGVPPSNKPPMHDGTENLNAFWSIFESDHSYFDLVWNATTRKECISAITNELNELLRFSWQQQQLSNNHAPGVVWNSIDFEILYPSLDAFGRIGGFYLSKLFDSSSDNTNRTNNKSDIHAFQQIRDPKSFSEQLIRCILNNNVQSIAATSTSLSTPPYPTIKKSLAIRALRFTFIAHHLPQPDIDTLNSLCHMILQQQQPSTDDIVTEGILFLHTLSQQILNEKNETSSMLSSSAVVDVVQLAIHVDSPVSAQALSCLDNLVRSRAAVDILGRRVRPPPKVLLRATHPKVLSTISKLIMSPSPDVVESCAGLLAALSRSLPEACDTLYRTMVFIRCLMYSGSNFNSIAEFLVESHLNQRFVSSSSSDNNHGSSISSHDKNKLYTQSILYGVLPEGLIQRGLIDNNGKDFARLFTSNKSSVMQNHDENVDPTVIWGSDMRQYLISELQQYLNENNQDTSSSSYDYFVPPPIIYPQLKQEVYAHEVYLGRFCNNTTLRKTWQIHDPLGMFRAVLELFMSLSVAATATTTVPGNTLKNTEVLSLEEAVEILELDGNKPLDAVTIRRAYRKRALELHPDRLVVMSSSKVTNNNSMEENSTTTAAEQIPKSNNDQHKFNQLSIAYRIVMEWLEQQQQQQQTSSGNNNPIITLTSTSTTSQTVINLKKDLVMDAQLILYERYLKSIEEYKYPAWIQLLTELQRSNRAKRLGYAICCASHYNAYELVRVGGLNVLANVLLNVGEIFVDNTENDLGIASLLNMVWGISVIPDLKETVETILCKPLFHSDENNHFTSKLTWFLTIMSNKKTHHKDGGEETRLAAVRVIQRNAHHVSHESNLDIAIALLNIILLEYDISASSTSNNNNNKLPLEAVIALQNIVQQSSTPIISILNQILTRGLCDILKECKSPEEFLQVLFVERQIRKPTLLWSLQMRTSLTKLLSDCESNNTDNNFIPVLKSFQHEQVKNLVILGHKTFVKIFVEVGGEDECFDSLFPQDVCKYLAGPSSLVEGEEEEETTTFVLEACEKLILDYPSSLVEMKQWFNNILFMTNMIQRFVITKYKDQCLLTIKLLLAYSMRDSSWTPTSEIFQQLWGIWTTTQDDYKILELMTRLFKTIAINCAVEFTNPQRIRDVLSIILSIKKTNSTVIPNECFMMLRDVLTMPTITTSSLCQPSQIFAVVQQFLPRGLVLYISNTQHTFTDFIEVINTSTVVETPELIWNDGMKQTLIRALTGGGGSSSSSSSFPSYDNWLQHELMVGNVYLRLFLKDPGYRLNDLIGFLQALLNEFVQHCLVVRNDNQQQQLTTIAGDSLLDPLSKCIVCILTSSTVTSSTTTNNTLQGEIEMICLRHMPSILKIIITNQGRGVESMRALRILVAMCILDRVVNFLSNHCQKYDVCLVLCLILESATIMNTDANSSVTIINDDNIHIASSCLSRIVKSSTILCDYFCNGKMDGFRRVMEFIEQMNHSRPDLTVIVIELIRWLESTRPTVKERLARDYPNWKNINILKSDLFLTNSVAGGGSSSSAMNDSKIMLLRLM